MDENMDHSTHWTYVKNMWKNVFQTIAILNLRREILDISIDYEKMSNIWKDDFVSKIYWENAYDNPQYANIL